MLEKVILNDKIEILEDGSVQVREVTRVLEDGKILSQKNTNRLVVTPGADINKLDDDRVKSVCNVIHTKDVVDKYKTKIAEAKKKGQ